ncbi:MAG: hypothetical protein ABSE22_09240 [Xanthobacteraceae bacterium]|jgi:hypothetical protein
MMTNVRLRTTIIVIVAIVCAPSAIAAELGKEFDSYTNMHTQSHYGSLFFSDEPPYKGFVSIDGDGDLKLPSQSHYCFILNHYSKQKGFENRLRTYRAITTKWYDGTNSKTERFHQQYIPTADERSVDVTDYCIYGTQNVVKIDIEFGSDDGQSFKHNISFNLK